MAVFENLLPELTDEHKALRRRGIEGQREALEGFVIRNANLVSSAVRSEMASTGCSYETACVALVQECDRWVANCYYMDFGSELDARETLSGTDE